MQAGKLRHRIIIKQRSTTQDNSGDLPNTWTTYATVWANVQPISGREYYAAQQVQSDATTKIQIRYDFGVAHNMRVYYGTRIYDIISILNMDERNKHIVLMCKEVI